MTRTSEIVELTRVRLLLFLREPEALFWVFVFPTVLAAVLGFAFRRGEVPPSRVGVVAGAAERAALDGAPGLELRVFASEAEAARELRAARVDAVLLSGTPPTVRLDPSRPEGELARLRVLRALAPPPGDGEALVLEPLEERGSRYIDFLFPGLIGMNVMGTGMWLLGFAVAEMRQRKLLRRLLVTPMRRSSFLASFLLSRLVFLAAEIGALVAFGALVLGVPFRAPVALFALLCLAGAVAFSALGLLVTARARTIQGASGMLNLALVPMWLLSGVFFSYERFPEALHPAIRLLPLTALNDGLRALMLDGAGAALLLGELAVLVAWGIGSFALGLRFFRWD